jgi:hypothetical protein
MTDCWIFEFHIRLGLDSFNLMIYLFWSPDTLTMLLKIKTSLDGTLDEI